MTPVNTSSPTPILDLLAPLPKPRVRNFGPNDDLVPILLVAAALMFRNYQLLIALFGIWMIVLFAVAIHELGHVAAGWRLGFRFQSVAIGPIWVKRDDSGWAVKPRRALLSGLTSMSVDRICQLRRRLMIYSAAGPAAGLLLGVTALVCLRIAINMNDPYPSLFLACCAGYSVLMSVVSLVPYRAGRYATDGMKLKVLLCSKEGTTRVLATHALEMQRRSGVDAFCLNSRWIRLASSPRNVASDPRYPGYSDAWAAYQSAGGVEDAAKLLEKCLASSAFLSGENRDMLIVEACIFAAWRRNDASKADIWFKRVANPERIHPLVRLRAEVALSCAHARFDDALQQLDRGLEIVRQLPVLGTRAAQGAAWLKWRRDVEMRREMQSAGAQTSF